MKNVLVVISGPSGVGKGTIVDEILKTRKDIAESVSCTTRTPRDGEVNGREYFFLSKEDFQNRIALGDFLEYDEHFGNFYGTPKSFVQQTLQEKSVILEIDVVGALNAKKAFPDSLLIMIVPPSVEELKRRLLGRNSETDEAIENRLSRLDYELSQADKYDYTVVNDDLNESVQRVCDLIDLAKSK